MELSEFREDLINEIESTSIVDSDYGADIFIEYCKDILINDYGVISDLNNVFVEHKTTDNKFRNMHIDAAYLELSINTLHLLYSDYNSGPQEIINNESINQKLKLMKNFVVNSLKGFYKNGQESNEATQLAKSLINNFTSINKIHLIIISTNLRSDRLKTTIASEPLIIGDKTFSVDVTFLDIENIFQTKSATFQRDDIIISTDEYGIKDGIPCIKANINSDEYDSYLAIVPGKFLSDIYLKYSARLLEGNVRSFLNTRGEINKGILNTILNNKDRFFAYNNGIAATADEIVLDKTEDGIVIKEFKNLQIINGGQTTASLASAVLKNNADLSGLDVQMKLSIIKKKEDTQDLVRLISKYANKQNKVTNADLNSNHDFYTRIEELSRRIKAPVKANETTQSIWFFERARGQYDQSKMKLKTKREKDIFELQNPKSQRFTKTDLAKYINSTECKPFDVSWGAEVNMIRFQERMEKDWERNNLKYNENYYKELIAKGILFKAVERLITDQEWYQENKGYRAQLVPYTISKFVYEINKTGMFINYRKIWEQQSCLDVYKDDLIHISKLVFDTFYDTNRQIANIAEYAKREVCWKKLNESDYELSDKTIDNLVTKEDLEVDKKAGRSDQKLTNELSAEIEIFKLGVSYWNRVIEVGKQLKELNPKEIELCEIAIKYVKQIYPMLKKNQAKEIWVIKQKMDKYL